MPNGNTTMTFADAIDTAKILADAASAVASACEAHFRNHDLEMSDRDRAAIHHVGQAARDFAAAMTAEVEQIEARERERARPTR